MKNLIRTALILLTFLPLSLWANEFSQGPITFPVKLNLTTSGEAYFYSSDADSTLINKYRMNPIVDAILTRIGEYSFRVELPAPIQIQLSNRKGTEFYGTRVIKSFIVHHIDVENLEILFNLRKGDVLAFDKFDRIVLEDVIEKVGRGQTYEVVQALKSKAFEGPRLSAVEAVEFNVQLEEAGSRYGAIVEHMHLKVSDFANIYGLFGGVGAMKTHSMHGIMGAFSPVDPLIQSYSKAVAQVQKLRARLSERNFLSSTRVEQPSNFRALVGMSSNVVQLSGAVRCSMVFKP